MFYITLHIYGVCDITVVRIFTPSEKLQKLYAEIVGKYQALQFQSGVNDIKQKVHVTTADMQYEYILRIEVALAIYQTYREYENI